MTLTETRPAAAEDRAPDAPETTSAGWLSTADHKRLGLLYLLASLVFLVVGGIAGGLLQGELSARGTQILGDTFFRAYGIHATLTAVLFLGPAWIGLGTYLVPLQIGSARLALPRLHALALWLYVAGGLLVIGAFVAGPVNGRGITSATPFPAPHGGAGRPTTVWVAGLVLVALATLLASLDLVVTVLKLRTEGMTFERLPAFTWATFLTALVSIFSTPVFLSGLVLLYIDQHLGGVFFTGNRAGQDVWQHTVWLFGRPEVYLLTLPALGVACDIVGTHTRKPLLGFPVVRVALGLFAVLSLGAWAAGSTASTAVILPTYTPLTGLLAVPVGLLALVWLGSSAKGQPRFHISLAFVVGFLGLEVFGAANALIAAIAGVHGGTAFGPAQAHMVAFAAPTMLVFGAVYHWAPKLFGRHLSAGLGGLVFLLLFGGFALTGLGEYLIGYDGGPAAVRDYAKGRWAANSVLATVGGVLVVLGVVVFVADLVKAGLGGRGRRMAADPYDGHTLEWAAASPPPAHNFDFVPEVRSAHPLRDLRGAGASEVA